MRVQCISPHNYPPCVCVCAHVCTAQTGSLRANGLSSKDCECSELGDACTAISAPPEARSDPSSPSVEPVASMPAAVADAPVDDSTPAGASPLACDACCLSLCALASRVSRCFSSDSPCESSPMSVVFPYCALSRVRTLLSTSACSSQTTLALCSPHVRLATQPMSLSIT